MTSITGPEPEQPRVGVQISSFRHGPFEFEDRIKVASEIGFKGVELIHWGPRPSPDPALVPAEEAREILERYGVKPVAVHLPSLTQVEQDFAQITGYHLRLGTQDLVISIVGQEVEYSTRSTAAWSDFGKRSKLLSARCRDMGFSLGLHNHVLELLPVQGRTGLFRIFDETEPEELFWEADVGHVAAGKTDFGELMKVLGDRCKLLHIKDLGPEVNKNPVLEGDGRLGDFDRLAAPVRQRIDWEVNLGSGVIDLERVIDWAEEAGSEWLLSETHREGLDLAHAFNFINSRLTAPI